MNDENKSIELRFGTVAHPFSVEEAMEEGASYRPVGRRDQILLSISEIKAYFQHVAPSGSENRKNESASERESLHDFLSL